jgi:hypothetical protein
MFSGHVKKYWGTPYYGTRQKDIESDFYINDSLNDNLETERLS